MNTRILNGFNILFEIKNNINYSLSGSERLQKCVAARYDEAVPDDNQNQARFLTILRMPN